jgi:5-methylcytosine-specific restriction endonuclease McrA
MTELDELVLEEAFILAAQREESTGIKWSVDHIVPLNHKHASGLHNAWNVQVVPALWNSIKRNTNMTQYITGY